MIATMPSLQNFLALCLLLLASVGLVRSSPSQCPYERTLEGYSDWNLLKNDILDFTNNKRTVFTLCPFTDFFLSENDDDGLNFNLKDSETQHLTIQCGSQGLLRDDCVIYGGHNHVWINRAPGGITFSGIRFQHADQTSIWAGTGQLGIVFRGCVFENNVYVSPYGANSDNQDPCHTGCAGVFSGEFGVASFEDCRFFNNGGHFGAIYGQDMELTFDSCVFVGNENTVSRCMSMCHRCRKVCNYILGSRS